jgi:predicted RNA binding protein with dsRBD fold (UPF0201 family)
MTVSHTAEEYALALRASRGLVTHAARRLGVTDEAMRQRLKRSPTLQQVRAEAREAMIDVAESSLFTQIEAGEAWAVCFFLKTQAKDRGYVERTEEHRAVTGDIRIRIEAVDDRGDPALG